MVSAEGGTHFALPGQSVSFPGMSDGAGRCADTADRRIIPTIGNSAGVIRSARQFATSNDGGGISADLLAERPVQVLLALRPCVNPGAVR
jgi:hypothetical protein